MDDMLASCLFKIWIKVSWYPGNVPLCSLQRLLPVCLDERNNGVVDVMSAIVPLATTLEVPCSCPRIASHSLLTALMLIPGATAATLASICLIYCRRKYAGWQHAHYTWFCECRWCHHSGAGTSALNVATWGFWRQLQLAWRPGSMLPQRTYWSPCRRPPILWWAGLTNAVLRVVHFYSQCLGDVRWRQQLRRWCVTCTDDGGSLTTLVTEAHH
jgi:hypothetical protein